MIAYSTLTAFNFIVSLVIFTTIAYAILSHRIKDGIIMKLGMILMAVGFLGRCLIWLEYHSEYAAEWSSAFIHLGVLVCFGGYLLRKKFARHKVRRSSDWAPLYDQEHT